MKEVLVVGPILVISDFGDAQRKEKCMGLIRMLGHKWAWPTFHLKNELALN